MILVANGGIQSQSWANDLFLSAGAALFGGALVRITLFGSAADENSDKPPTSNSQFNVFKRNQDLGRDYWINFISEAGTDLHHLWFVGRRHKLWIDDGHPYRREVTKSLRERMDNSADSKDRGQVTIIVSDEHAFAYWKEFIVNEIVTPSNAAIVKRLIRVGHAKDKVMVYSAVAQGSEVLITTLLSSGRSADSPTFAVNASSEIGRLYQNDIEKLSKKLNTWWTYEHSGVEG